MKYIIMCGGKYRQWETPRHLLKINGEPIVMRTIRLLKENGIEDIAISSNNPEFKKCGVPVLAHHNDYDAQGYNNFTGSWCSAFYPTEEPTCYIFGDVVFSPESIKKIIETKTDDIEFFASAPPFGHLYPKKYAEPFALKVVNNEHLKWAIEKTKQLALLNKFNRKPIMWELWQVIKDTPLNVIDYTNYTAINDYTCDIDNPSEIKMFESLIGEPTPARYMIHTMPKRLWYVNDFLIPSMLKQGIDKDAITIFNDVEKLGNLKACMKAFLEVDDKSEGTWHLQDDIIISKKFKSQTELHNKGIVCAFKSYYDNNTPSGVVPVKQMWWSFPCIRIPNKIAKECAKWTLNYMIGNPVYRDWWKDGKGDDKFFRHFVFDNYKDAKVLNLDPNIVEHVDYLLGGSTYSAREEIVKSLLWDENNLVSELDAELRRIGKRDVWQDYNRRILERR